MLIVLLNGLQSIQLQLKIDFALAGRLASCFNSTFLFVNTPYDRLAYFYILNQRDVKRQRNSQYVYKKQRM